MIELESPQIEPVEELGIVRQVRGRPAAGRLRRDPRQRAPARPAVVARGRGRHVHPDPRRLPGVLHDPGRQGGRHPDRPQRQEAAPQELRHPPGPAQADQERRRARSPPPTSPSRPTSRSSTPSWSLMTLDSDDVTIEMDLTVERGVGYLAAERAESLPIGVIPVDAIFTPGPQGQLLGREHPRRPDDQLRQADDRDRDRRHDHARGGARRGPPTSSSASSSLFANDRHGRRRPATASPAARRSCRRTCSTCRSRSSTCRCGPTTRSSATTSSRSASSSSSPTTTCCGCATSARSRSTR